MIRLLTGDCRTILPTLADRSVHCCVTSPPYFGLRDYGTDGQIGLEPTPQAYVEQLVAVFREVRRVLRDDGTLWLNLGDSYASAWACKRRNVVGNGSPDESVQRGRTGDGLKEKDLCGIPWRVAFALQADGWYLRQDIIWAKHNPMPESVTDRCTKAHEYIFLLSKNARYYYDAEAIAEPVVYASEVRVATPKNLNGLGLRPTREYGFELNGKRNKRSVWEIATQPYSEAHFATFPPALIEPCILAGCPDKCCAKCGAPHNRQTEYGKVLSTGGSDKGMRANNMAAYDPSGAHSVDSAYNTGNMVQREKITVGFRASCQCNAGTVPGTVLDPFSGAGTTGLVADRLNRNALLIELNPAYSAMGETRIRDDAPLFADVAHI